MGARHVSSKQAFVLIFINGKGHNKCGEAIGGGHVDLIFPVVDSVRQLVTKLLRSMNAQSINQNLQQLLLIDGHFFSAPLSMALGLQRHMPRGETSLPMLGVNNVKCNPTAPNGEGRHGRFYRHQLLVMGLWLMALALWGKGL